MAHQFLRSKALNSDLIHYMEESVYDRIIKLNAHYASKYFRINKQHIEAMSNDKTKVPKILRPAVVHKKDQLKEEELKEFRLKELEDLREYKKRANKLIDELKTKEIRLKSLQNTEKMKVQRDHWKHQRKEINDKSKNYSLVKEKPLFKTIQERSAQPNLSINKSASVSLIDIKNHIKWHKSLRKEAPKVMLSQSHISSLLGAKLHHADKKKKLL